MLLADGERAIIGSINLAPGSFDSRRELAIEVDDKHIVDRLHEVVSATGRTLTRLISRTKDCWLTWKSTGGKGLEELGLKGECQTAFPAQPYIWEKDAGLSTRLEMLLTIASELYLGKLDSFFHCGSLRNASHFTSISEMSGKLTI